MASPPNNLYQALGVPPTATNAEITAAYHRRVRQFHPDTGQHSDPDELRRVLAAYQRVRELRQSPDDSANQQPELPAVPIRDRNPGTVSVRLRQCDHSRAPDLRAGPVRRHHAERSYENRLDLH